MNVPNGLTIARLFLTVVFAVFTQTQGTGAALGALFVFIAAAFTDFADGYIARKYSQITSFGKIMDPVADKFLTLTAMVVFAFEGIFILWMVVLVALREIVVTGVRLHALISGRVIPAESSGKVKTAFQMAAISLALVYRLGAVYSPTQEVIKNHQILLAVVMNGVMIATVLLTLWSGGIFLKNLVKKGSS